jgi:hypothetical protein
MKTKAVHLASILVLGISLLALTPFQQSAQAQQLDPLPVPRLTLNSVQDYRNLGTQFTYTFSVTNWAEFQRQVDQRYDAFDPATMQLPPSPCKIEGDARFPSRMAAMIYSGEGKPLTCYPLFTPKGQLAEIKLTLPKANAPTSFYLVIRDLRTTEKVRSNTVDTGSHNKTVPITKSPASVQQQQVAEARPSFASGQKTDLSARRALYFTGQKTEKIDLKNDKYVAADKAITLKKSEATACDSEGCTFNVGFIAFRTSPVGALKTYALLQGAGIGIVGNTVQFADKETTRQGVLSLKLKVGRNKVTFQIDPYNETPETDETNNSFSVWISVEP